MANPDVIIIGAGISGSIMALELAKKWKDAAFRNAKQIEWQTWAQRKYRALAKGQRAEPAEENGEKRETPFRAASSIIDASPSLFSTLSSTF